MRPDIPPQIFQAALETFLACRRLDMGELARRVGVSRATLYRQAGSRDVILGEVIWHLALRAMSTALGAAEGRTGADRIAFVAERFMRFVRAQAPLQRFLAEEPAAALRVLTSKQGPIQGRLIALTARVIVEERERGALEPGMQSETLAYLIVRIGESFLYADVIAGHEPDLDLAVALIVGLLSANSDRVEEATG